MVNVKNWLLDFAKWRSLMILTNFLFYLFIYFCGAVRTKPLLVLRKNGSKELGKTKVLNMTYNTIHVLTRFPSVFLTFLPFTHAALATLASLPESLCHGPSFCLEYVPDILLVFLSQVVLSLSLSSS